MFDVQTTRQLGSSFSLRVIILCKCVQTVKIHLPLFILTVFALQVFNGPVPYKAATDAALPKPMKHERQHNAAATPHYSFIPHDSNGAQGEAVWHQWGEQQSHELYQWEEQQSHLPTAEPYFLQPPACVNPSVDVEQGGIGLLLGMDPEGSCSVDAVLPGGQCLLLCPCCKLLSCTGIDLYELMALCVNNTCVHVEMTGRPG